MIVFQLTVHLRHKITEMFFQSSASLSDVLVCLWFVGCDLFAERRREQTDTKHPVCQLLGRADLEGRGWETLLVAETPNAIEHLNVIAEHTTRKEKMYSSG